MKIEDRFYGGHGISLPQNQRNVSHDQAEQALAKMGYTLDGADAIRHASTGTTWRVRRGGQVLTLTTDAIKKIIYEGQ